VDLRKINTAIEQGALYPNTAANKGDLSEALKSALENGVIYHYTEDDYTIQDQITWVETNGGDITMSSVGSSYLRTVTITNSGITDQIVYGTIMGEPSQTIRAGNSFTLRCNGTQWLLI